MTYALRLDESDVSIMNHFHKMTEILYTHIKENWCNHGTPTVKLRFERLVNVGFVRVVIPFDFSKVDASHHENIIQMQNIEYYNKGVNIALFF